MKTILKKVAVFCIAAMPFVMPAQVDLTVGLNYAYNPPTGCNNKITGISIDVCNNGSSSASSFLVAIYLYDSGSSKHWCIDQTTVNSLSGNACVTINNWDIDFNNYAGLPAPGSNYRLGVWVDTANAITETSKSNNASLLSGNIQVCAPSGIKDTKGVINSFDMYPNPFADKGTLSFNLLKEEKVNVTVYDLTGKAVLKAFDGNLLPGSQTIPLNVNSLTNGVYMVTLSLPEGILTKKLIVQK